MGDSLELELVDVRCKNCNKVLLKASMLVGAIKCNRCKMIFEYRVYSSLQPISNYDMMTISSTENKPHVRSQSDND